MKVGDLVRSTDNEVHKHCGYGFVVEDHPTRSSKKGFVARLQRQNESSLDVY